MDTVLPGIFCEIAAIAKAAYCYTVRINTDAVKNGAFTELVLHETHPETGQDVRPYRIRIEQEGESVNIVAGSVKYPFMPHKNDTARAVMTALWMQSLNRAYWQKCGKEKRFNAMGIASY